MYRYCTILLGVYFCLRIPQWYNHCNVQVFFYNNSFQHMYTLVDIIEHNLVTNIYQFGQNRLDMHIKYKNWHKHLYWYFSLPCNDNVKEYYSLLSFWTFLKQLGDKETPDNPKKCWRFYVTHILYLECDNYFWRAWHSIGVYCYRYL